MSARRVWVPGLAAATVGDVLPVAADESRYLARVLRLRAGARVRLVDGQGSDGEGELMGVGVGAGAGAGTQLAVRVLGRRAAAEASAPVTVAVCAPKGARLAWLVEKLTELAVAQIDWLVTARSQPHSQAALLAQPGRLERLARAAARQSGGVSLPRLRPPQPLAVWLAQRPTAPSHTTWICQPGAPAGRPTATALGAPQTVLVGPEGGFHPDEVAACAAAGLVPLGLGPQVLRVETAAVVAVARLVAP